MANEEKAWIVNVEKVPGSDGREILVGVNGFVKHGLVGDDILIFDAYLMALLPKLLEVCKSFVVEAEKSAMWDKMGESYYTAKKIVQITEALAKPMSDDSSML